MNLPITVTVDVAKATAKLSGPLVLGNTYQVTFQGLTATQAARHPTLVLLGRPRLVNELDAGGNAIAAPNVAAMSTVDGVLALNTQEMADAFTMAAMPPQAVAEQACDARRPQAVLPGEVLHGAVRPHAVLALHFYVTTQGTEEAGVDTSAESDGATLAQGDCTVHWAPFEFDGSGNPIILRGPAGAVGPVGPGCVAAWAGCVSFYIDFDSTSGTFGHLIACAENRGDLFHDGADGSAVGIAAKPHFVLAGAENPSVQPPESIAGQLTDGHLYAIHYGTDGDTAQCLDLGSIGGGIALATMLKNSMEDDSQDGVSARTLNETSSKVNSLWTRIKNACSALMGNASAMAIAVGAGILIGAARPAAADVAQAIGDMDPDTPVYSAAQIDARGTGFPLAEDADFAGHSATNVAGIQLEGSTNVLTADGDTLYFGGGRIKGSGSLESVWGPVSYTNQETYATNASAQSIGIKPAASNANMVIKYDPDTSTYEFRAVSGIPGPRGADGIGNVLWAGNWYSGMVFSNDNTWVSWNGSIWTRPASPDPVTTAPTNVLPWTLVVSRGNDGTEGSDGRDGIGLHVVEWSTNLVTIDPDMLISHDGFLLVSTNTVSVPNPGQPVVNRSVQRGYKALVWPGADGAAADVYTNMAFVIDFDPGTAVQAHSLVVWQSHLWYAKQDYNPTNGTGVPPSEGPAWTCVGQRGERGPQGLNGIGNLRYVGEWDSRRTNYINDIVRYRRADGRYDWYRAITEPITAGTHPAANTNQWVKEITSGTDANTVEWKIVDGEYDASVVHSNELYRAPNGTVYYTKGEVPVGPGFAPGTDRTGKWDVFVKDGTTVAGTNGIVWRGLWDETYGYAAGDMVTHPHGDGARSLYIASTNSNGKEPPDANYWITVASGIKGDRGQRGEDGTATYTFVTNVTTYERAEIITNTFNITNDNTTAIVDYDTPSQVYNRVKFYPDHFDYNPLSGIFSLKPAALVSTTLNGWSGAVTLAAGTNIVMGSNSATHTITINATVPPAGVESLNTLTGAVSLVGAGDVTVTPSGSTITISATSSGGGGGWGAEAKALYLTSSWNMPPNANDYGAIGVNTSNGDATITLAAQTNYQNVVITKFSNVNSLFIVGTTTNVITHDGQSITLDYWPEQTNWYWRMY